jgi:hypothetical protein
LHGLAAGFGRHEAGPIENTVALQSTVVMGPTEPCIRQMALIVDNNGIATNNK